MYQSRSLADESRAIRGRMQAVVGRGHQEQEAFLPLKLLPTKSFTFYDDGY